ncbi:MaoC family dehydratase [Kitasatospora sp. NPDC048239]|uniref:MaoC family dehydratase n=1 Tax=Kitasatospora sp. NPDC048239 TaxID=3364046 RepID=UPI003720C7C5
MTGADAASADAANAGIRNADIKYWEDLVDAPVRRFGPLVVEGALMDHLLDLMGEKHPIHDDAAFARALDRQERIVPGGFLHSVTSGWSVQHGSPAAIVGMRRLTWDFLRPVYPDQPFWFTTETERSAEIDERRGTIDSVRKVFDAEGRTHAIGRMSLVVLRRPATAAATAAAAAGTHSDEGTAR